MIIGSYSLFGDYVSVVKVHVFAVNSLIKKLLERNGFQLELLTRINPIRPDYLVYKSFYMPDKLAKFLSRLTRRIPLRKQFFMSILVVANKVN